MSVTFNAQPNVFAFNPVYSIIRAIYHVASDVNSFLNNQIEEMKVSANPTISRTGRVLEAAKFGFGMGYMSSAVIITLGQLLCGFTGPAMSTVASTAAFSNPLVMTCAAFGAVYFGWNALSPQEKADTIERIRADLDVGSELINSIAQFVIIKTKEFLDSDNLRELKQNISDAAHQFGKTLGDVTHAIKDRVVDAYATAKSFAGEAGDAVAIRAESGFITMKETTGEIVESVVQTAEYLKDSTKNAIKSKADTIKDKK